MSFETRKMHITRQKKHNTPLHAHTRRKITTRPDATTNYSNNLQIKSCETAIKYWFSLIDIVTTFNRCRRSISLGTICDRYTKTHSTVTLTCEPSSSITHLYTHTHIHIPPIDLCHRRLELFNE